MKPLLLLKKQRKSFLLIFKCLIRNFIFSKLKVWSVEISYLRISIYIVKVYFLIIKDKIIPLLTFLLYIIVDQFNCLNSKLFTTINAKIDDSTNNFHWKFMLIIAIIMWYQFEWFWNSSLYKNFNFTTRTNYEKSSPIRSHLILQMVVTQLKLWIQSELQLFSLSHGYTWQTRAMVTTGI